MSSHAGANLRRFRRAKGLSLEALAREAGLSTATVYRAEHRRHRTTDETWAALAQALGVPVESITVIHDADQGDSEIAAAAESRGR
jgi:transcriptional regulator with XRE-family HTH domain